MEILFVALIGGAIGGAVRYLLPHHDRYGVVLLPAQGAMTASIVWVLLTWAGLKWNAGLIWWISLLIPVAVTAVTAVVLGARRVRHDTELFDRVASGRSARA